MENTVFRSYEQIKSEAIVTRKASDKNSWHLGDLGVELEDLGAHLRGELLSDPGKKMTEEELDLSKDDRALLERLADDIGLPKKSVFIRTKVSRRVKETGPLGWIRHSTLSYAIMRELYALENDDDLNRLAKKAVAQNMSVRDMRTEMEGYRDKKGVESGLYICKTCDEPIRDIDNLISINRTGEGRLPFCCWNCASVYTEKKANEEGRVAPSANADPVFTEDDTDTVCVEGAAFQLGSLV